MRDTHIHYRLLPLHDLICEELIFILVLLFHWTILVARHSHSFSSSSSSGRSHFRGTHIHSRVLLPLDDLICESFTFILVLLFARHSLSFSTPSTAQSYLWGTHIHSRSLDLLPLHDLICEALTFILVLSFHCTILFGRHSHSFSFSPSTARSYLGGTHIHSRSLLPLHDLIWEALTFILVLSFPAPDFTDRRPVSR